MAHRNLFLRDYTKANKHPVGCVAVEVDRAAKQIRYALSVCSPLDKWNSRIANDKAVGRLRKAPNVIIVDNVPDNNHDITRTVMNHIVATHGTQKSGKSRSVLALQAAQAWLENGKHYATNTESQAA